MTEFISNDQLQLAFDFVQYTGKHIFLTGKAGTGKTTFLHQLKLNSPKRMVVVAPTGVAAINAGGVTIHSFFQMPFGPFLSSEITGNTSSGNEGSASPENFQKFNREKIAIIKSLDLLVIDEISMVRADLLDGIDSVLRRYKDRNKPFGGVQLLMIGDLQQLAPVVKDDDWNLLRPYYDTVFFFSSKALKKTDYVSIELTHIFRQRDEVFIRLLNKIRDNSADQQTLDELNQRYIPGFVTKDGDGYITLTTHNYQSHDINDSKLEKLAAKVLRFIAKVEGEFPEFSYPTDFEVSILPVMKDLFVLMSTEVKRDLCDVSEKFKGQLQHLLAENNDVELNIPLQDRIQKACRYFSEKLEPIVIDKLKDLDIEIDNKTVRKSVKDAVGKLSEEVTVKHACLKGCAGGFNVKRYMEIRAKAAIEPSELKQKSKTSAYSSDIHMEHPKLYKQLRAWRNNKASELNVEAYMVLPQKLLLELTTKMPVSFADLKKIKGVGAKKAAQFGKEIVNMIIGYKVGEKMEVTEPEDDMEPEIKPKLPKIDTKLVSYEMFKNGKSIDAIAKERGFVASTIEAHLSHYVGTGELGLEGLVDPKKAALISDWYLQHPMLGSGPAKAALGENVSFSELRFVWIYLMYTKQITV